MVGGARRDLRDEGLALIPLPQLVDIRCLREAVKKIKILKLHTSKCANRPHPPQRGQLPRDTGTG